MQAGDDRFNSTRDRNMHLKFIPSAYGQEEEEMNLNAAGRRGGFIGFAPWIARQMRGALGGIASRAP